MLEAWVWFFSKQLLDNKTKVFKLGTSCGLIIVLIAAEKTDALV